MKGREALRIGTGLRKEKECCRRVVNVERWRDGSLWMRSLVME